MSNSKTRLWKALGQFLTTAFIFLGLTLLAWGLNDLKAYFSNPVRTAFAMLMVAYSLFMAWLVYVSPPHEDPEHRFDLARWHAYMFETIFVLSAFGDRRNILAWPENTPLRWLGMAIYLIGLALSVWANLTWLEHLKREGDRAQEHPVLLFEGPFQWIRHPSLLSLTFYCLGFALMFRSWVGLVLMVALIGGIINRINNMEKVFEVRYKKVWAMRRHTSKRIIPHIY
jgi:protein-S-isoprenylcysteine O-methyltransferase Ste14